MAQVGIGGGLEECQKCHILFEWPFKYGGHKLTLADPIKMNECYGSPYNCYLNKPDQTLPGVPRGTLALPEATLHQTFTHILVARLSISKITNIW